ncbi:flagellin [Armatimonas sp.]|uniref:flagellin N-terminal helical domain-containing protein n=1 Tax=Armatimonas sp. TaxID=1872638 RepID=UPI00286B1E11|nr:flagellin [Armatimonas sp.]
MGMVVNFNAAALNAQRNLGQTSKGLNQSIQRLSSGLQVNGAADSPAGLVISEQMRSKADGMSQAVKNTNDGINLIKTAEGALNEVHSLLRQMRTLSVHAANEGVNSADDLAADQAAIAAAGDSIDRIGASTRFNGKLLLDGNYTAQKLQIGEESTDTFDVSIADLTAVGLGVDSGTLDVTAVGGGTAAIDAIDAAIKTVSTERAKLGATQKYTLETTVNSLSVSEENIRSSESAIRDADMSKEMVEFTRNNIMMQAGTSMLAQANQSSQSVLSLLRG